MAHSDFGTALIMSPLVPIFREVTLRSDLNYTVCNN